MANLEQLGAAARRMILADSGFSALIGTDVGTDTMAPDKYNGAYNDGWVMQGIGVEGNGARDATATGTSVITLNIRGGWTSANTHNTPRFPQLLILIRSDMTRGTADNATFTKRDAELRCSRVADNIIPIFHDAANVRHWWGTIADFPPNGVYVSSSVQASQLSIKDVNTSDGLVVGELRFNLTTD